MFISEIQINHIARFASQYFSRPEVGIVGGYHGGNLGDIALGISIKNLLDEIKVNSGLQTIYNLERWPETTFAILGGGAIGYTDSLVRVAKRYKNNYKHVGLLGVDFNEKEYPNACLDLIRGAAFVSGRSKKQAERLIQLTGRKDIFHHPDIAFSLLNDFCSQQRSTISNNKQKKLLINVLPLYAQVQNSKVIPVEKYYTERPELYKEFQTMHDSYKAIIRRIVSEALNDGYVVETIPFTPLDDQYGKLILKDLPVRHAEYHSDPIRMIKHMATSDWVIATRFHATIFALKLGVKLTPIAYATKNELMLQELGLSRSSFLTTGDLANGIDQALEPVKVDSNIVTQWELSSKKAINDCINMTMSLSK